MDPARLKPGITQDRITGGNEADQTNPAVDRVIRGRALIFWDPERPGEKQNAIDTDQITPSNDCVSESLDHLEKRWKEGAFRYLMPDFRKRVQAGENFLIAGDRFGIGSSREMSPAGLKGVAEEAGLELVILCGANLGDIFRRNALNLGLHVLEVPEAVADAGDGDHFVFDPVTRTVRNETKGRSYEPVALTEKEEAIRRHGGIFRIGRREFPESIRFRPRVEFPDPSTARAMTATEQIIWAHRVDRTAEVRPGNTLRVWADLLPASDGTAPFAIHTFNRITGGDTIYPRQAAIVSDHFVFTGKESDRKQTSISREFAQLNDIRPPFYAPPGAGIFHLYLPEQGLVLPGAFIPGADSHSRAYGAYGAVGIGVGSTTLGFGWSTGYVYFTLAPQRRVIFTGQLQAWVTGKDIVLELIRRWGPEQSGRMSVEFTDANLQLPIHYRNTIANMMAEGEAQNGIFPPDEITLRWFRENRFPLPYPSVRPGPRARFAMEETIDLCGISSMVAKPFSPANAHRSEQVAAERIEFNKAMIGSCTNGSYPDLLGAALVLRAAREHGRDRVVPGVDFIIFPGSGAVKERIEKPEPRLQGESIAGVFRGAGGKIRDSWCGPCFGQGPDALGKGERAITSFNRNWQNRMGIGGEGFLASPPVVAASALLGYIAPPSELGLAWDPDRFGI